VQVGPAVCLLAFMRGTFNAREQFTVTRGSKPRDQGLNAREARGHRQEGPQEQTHRLWPVAVACGYALADSGTGTPDLARGVCLVAINVPCVGADGLDFRSSACGLISALLAAIRSSSSTSASRGEEFGVGVPSWRSASRLSWRGGST